MSENKDTKNSKSTAANRKFTPYDILQLILSNWYWFVLSVAICYLGANLYLRRTAPQYLRTATVLVKDSRKGSGSEVTAFNDLVGGIGRRSVDNEIHIFKSRHLMEQVVIDNDLTTRYTTHGRIRTTDMYGRCPMVVNFIDNSMPGSFSFTMNSDSTVRIANFSAAPNFQVTAMAGDTVATPMGEIVLKPTPYFERYKHLEITVTKMTLNDATELYRNRLSCDIADKQASVITLSMTDVVPKRAEDVINGIIEAYNVDAINDKRQISEITEQFISERLESLGEELNLADSEIAEFKQEYRLYSLEDEASLSSSEIQRLNQDELSLEANLEMSQYILDYITSDESGLALIPASTATLSGMNTALVSQIEHYNMGILELQRLNTETSDSNPVLINIRNQIDNIRTSIISSLESHIGGLELQIERLNSELQLATTRMESSPTMEMELLSITRQQKVKEELYIYLLTKLEENALMGATAESNARIIDSAYGSDRPVSPRRSLIYLIALILGAIIPFGIFYLREVLDTKVRTRREIEEAISAPFLGDIPRANGKSANGIVVKEEGRDAVSESFRMLRANMNFMAVNDIVQVVMLTSSIPHSGKTFVSTNLAMTIALSGRRVLLIDGDLRRRTMTKQFGHRNDRRGITSYLTNSISSLNDIISKSELNENLDIIYTGPQPPNPAELLMSKRMEELMTELRSRYDYIIIDSVPAMAVADAIIMDQLVDLTIYVIRQGHLDYRHLPDIERLYTEKKFHNMSVILNSVTASKRTYGYGYGYGYGYANDEETPWQRRYRRLKKLFKKRRS